GAVGTSPELRGRGLQRQLMPRLLEQARPEDLVFLFANEAVVDFYPRFGFRRKREHQFGLPLMAAPAAAPLRKLDLASADDRATLQRIAARAQPVTERIGAADYGTTVLFYWSNFYPDALRHAPEADAIFAVQQLGDTLHVHDVLAPALVDLVGHVPRLIDAPIRQLALGFSPDRYGLGATPLGEYTESPLFVRGPHTLPPAPFKFPVFAQT
ncbi:MAG: GNAT family N-acetyltransferase, partial [Polyangiales bacterium]